MKPTPEDAVRIANLAGLEQVANQLPPEVRATLLLAVELALEEGFEKGLLQQLVNGNEKQLAAWRAGARFGVKAMAEQDVAFLTDQMRMSAAKVAVDMCCAEREALRAQGLSD